jgi:hypothetical protein
MSPHVQEKLRKKINDLLANDIIEESNSEWSSPCLVVLKTDGLIRAVVDFREANKQFKGNSYSLPLVDYLIARVNQSKFITKFDLSKGFYQIKVAEESKQYAAFCTPFGLFNFKRTHFGLKTSPSLFQSVMQKVLGGLEEFCGVFIDDIIIFSDNWEDHLKHVRIVLTRLLKAKLTVKLSKCFFAVNEIDYLGQNFGNGKM